MPVSSNQPSFLLLGQVLRPHGVRGELRVKVLTAYPDAVKSKSRVFLGPDPHDASKAVAYRLLQVRRQQQHLILLLEGIADRSRAELVREQYVMVAFDEAVPLEEGEFYLFQAIGLSVVTEDGELLGQVVDVLSTGANDVYVVQGSRGEILLPDIAECVLKVDIENQMMAVRLLDGLLGE